MFYLSQQYCSVQSRASSYVPLVVRLSVDRRQEQDIVFVSLSVCVVLKGLQYREASLCST